jgi:hypothetical protein
MEESFLRHMRPDDDLLDLIDWAFLEGKIDAKRLTRLTCHTAPI